MVPCSFTPAQEGLVSGRLSVYPPSDLEVTFKTVANIFPSPDLSLSLFLI